MRTSKVITISVPPKFENEIQKHARYEHRTISEYVREAVRQYMTHQEFDPSSRQVAERLKKRGLRTSDRERTTQTVRERLGRESAKLNPRAEQALADQGLKDEFKNWPKY